MDCSNFSNSLVFLMDFFNTKCIFKDNMKWISSTQGIAAGLFGYYVWLK